MFKHVAFFSILGIFSVIFISLDSTAYSHGKFYQCVYVMIIFILVGAFTGGFSIHKYEIDPKLAKPNEGIKRSLSYMVKTFFFLFFVAALISWGKDFSFIFNPVLICIGLVMGVLGGLGIFGSPGIVCIQHFTLRIILHCKNYMPLNYVHFLEYATRLNFLRKVGGSYIFFHRMLQDHFADMKE